MGFGAGSQATTHQDGTLAKDLAGCACRQRDSVGSRGRATSEHDVRTTFSLLPPGKGATETQALQARASKKASLQAKRGKPRDQPRSSRTYAYEAGSRLRRSFRDIHDSDQLATLRGRDDVFFCRLCVEVNAGGSLRPLKLWSDGSGESRRKARRKLDRGTMSNDRVRADAGRAIQRVVPHCFRGYWIDPSGRVHINPQVINTSGGACGM